MTCAHKLTAPQPDLRPLAPAEREIDAHAPECLSRNRPSKPPTCDDCQWTITFVRMQYPKFGARVIPPYQTFGTQNCWSGTRKHAFKMRSGESSVALETNVGQKPAGHCRRGGGDLPEMNAAPLPLRQWFIGFCPTSPNRISHRRIPSSPISSSHRRSSSV